MLLFRSKTFSSLINISWRAIVTGKSADPYFLTGGATKWGNFPWRCHWRHWAAEGCEPSDHGEQHHCVRQRQEESHWQSLNRRFSCGSLHPEISLKKKKWRLSSYALLNVIFHWGRISVDSSLSANAATGRRRLVGGGCFVPSVLSLNVILVKITSNT